MILAAAFTTSVQNILTGLIEARQRLNLRLGEMKQRGVDVEIIEANIDNLTPEEVKERIRSLRPSVAGIPGMSLEYWRQAHRTAQLVKEVDRSITTVLGGALPSSLPERVLEDDNVDYVILGEGEEL